MASKIKVDQLETADGTGTIALQNQLSGMTSASMPTGSVLQVVHTEHSGFVTTTSTSWSTGMTGAITPSSTSSKIVLMYCGQLLGTNQTDAQLKLFRGTLSGTSLPTSGGMLVNNFMTDTGDTVNASFHWLDSPSTTSSQTYTVAFRSSVSGQQVKFGNSSARDSLILMEVAG